jgi:hypothetical protein
MKIVHIALLCLIVCVFGNNGTYILIENTWFYKFDPIAGKLTEKIEGADTTNTYSGITVDEANKRLFWVSYDLGSNTKVTMHGYSMSRNENYASLFTDNAFVSYVFYDNIRAQLYGIVRNPLNSTFNIVQQNGTTLELSRTLSTAAHIYSSNVGDILGYDANTNCLIFNNWMHREINLVDITSGKVQRTIPTKLGPNLILLQSYYLNVKRQVVTVVQMSNALNATASTFEVDLKTGELSKPVLLFEDTSLELSGWYFNCLNQIDNILVLGMRVQVNGVYYTDFHVYDMISKKRISMTRLDWIDLRKLVYMP